MLLVEFSVKFLNLEKFHTHPSDAQAARQIAFVCVLQMTIYWMNAPACSCFKSLQMLCKWGFPLDPILCNMVCAAYGPVMLIFQQLFLYHRIIISGSPTHTPLSSVYVFEASKQNLPHHCVDLLPVVGKVFWNFSEEATAHSVSGLKCVVYFLQTFLHFDKIF